MPNHRPRRRGLPKHGRVRWTGLETGLVSIADAPCDGQHRAAMAPQTALGLLVCSRLTWEYANTPASATPVPAHSKILSNTAEKYEQGPMRRTEVTTVSMMSGTSVMTGVVARPALQPFHDDDAGQAIVTRDLAS